MDKRLLASALLLLAGAGCTATTTVDTTGDGLTATMPVIGEDGTPADVDETLVGGDADVNVEVNLNGDTVDTNVEVSATVQEFAVTGNSFTFSPSTMTVKKGETVRITFTNEEGFHDWKIDEFNAATKQISAGVSETIEFVADQSGSFEYYCSVGSHRAMGMKGTLTVTE